MPKNEGPRELLSLLSDDVRREVGNKFSVMGIYGEAIVIPKLPAVLPRLVLTKAFEGGSGEYDLTLDIRAPDKTSLFEDNKPREFGVAAAAEKRWNVVLGFAPVRFEKPGEYDAVVTLTHKGDPSERYQYSHKFNVVIGETG